MSGLNDQLTDGAGSWASAKGTHQGTRFNDSPVPSVAAVALNIREKGTQNQAK